MDDSLQIIIYIVFIAIYFLSRFLKGNKQKASRPRPRQESEEEGQVETNEQPMTFQDILRELTQPREAPAPQPKKRAPVEPGPRDYEFKGDYPDEAEIQEVYEESLSRAKNVKTLDEMINIGEESIKFKEYQEADQQNALATEIREMLKDPYDAKRAIILKEILDRKF
ncbi:MAG TPA: hypothetical protein VGA21_09765 [Cyclobacteriaceae bacterium]|jgi:hypothetical protein